MIITQVQCFDEINIDKLQDKINDWLTNKRNIVVRDIKYQIERESRFTSMIVYKEDTRLNSS